MRAVHHPSAHPLRAIAALAGLVAALTACSSGSTATHTASTTSRAAATTTAPIAQTPPAGTNGLAFAGNRLWVADLRGGELLAVDPDTGRILERHGAADGVVAPDDVAVGPDGAIYWTGFGTGVIGRMDRAGHSTIIATLRPGANPIAFARDGRLYVGLAVIADGLYQIDPRGRRPPRLVAPSLGNVNAFTIARDGFLYGPRFGLDGAGALVRVDLRTGTVTEVMRGFGYPVAVKLDPRGRLYVLATGPPGVFRIDLAARRAMPVGTPSTPVVDNFAFDRRGRLFVSGFAGPMVTEIRPDGTARAVHVGS